MDTTAEIVDVKWFGHDVIHSRFEASLLSSSNAIPVIVRMRVVAFG
jgi:hypothetical protein